jgi:CubicO group peptidase (beta-lactamase class C family)
MIRKMVFQVSIGIFILVLGNACMVDEALNLPFESYDPQTLDDGLTLSQPETEQMDATALTEIYKYVYSKDNLWPLRSLLVFRNNKLVAESYLKDKDDITTRHIIWSCTKQVLGVLIGKALEDGVLVNLNDPISDYFDRELNGHNDKKNITLRNLLTMQSGIAFENNGPGSDDDLLLRQIPENSVDFILAKPLIAEQGITFDYHDGNPHLLSAIIQKKVGKPTDVWADAVLFERIGFRNYEWVRYKDGITMGGWGILTTPREMAKVALMVADSGRWKGEQIVNAEWIRAMTTPYIKNAYLDFSFGYYWWIDEDRDMYFMDGHGGQFAFIVPRKNLVIVMTSFPQTLDDYQILVDEAVPVVDMIIEAAY